MKINDKDSTNWINLNSATNVEFNTTNVSIINAKFSITNASATNVEFSTTTPSLSTTSVLVLI